MPTNDRRLIQSLVTLRKAHGLKQADLAERVGVARSTIGDFETSPQHGISPSLWVINRYAEALGARLEVRSVS